MAEYPFLKLYTDAYLGDTPAPNPRTWAHHGIYMLALMFAWRTPGCRLPDDPEWLAQRFGCSVRELEREVMPVIRLYFRKRGKGWSQKRLTKERGKAKTASETASRNAKSRWANEKAPCQANAGENRPKSGRPAHQSPESRTTPRTRKTPPLSSPPGGTTRARTTGEGGDGGGGSGGATRTTRTSASAEKRIRGFLAKRGGRTEVEAAQVWWQANDPDLDGHAGSAAEVAEVARKLSLDWAPHAPPKAPTD